jgi:calcineurin-like phosphoesterase family protein
MTVEEHVEWILNIHNSTVGDDDTLYHLGDFSFLNWKKRDLLLNVVDRMKGNLVLVIGNHDSRNALDYIAEIARINNPRGLGRHIIVGDYEEIKIGGVLTVMSHYPFAVWNSSHHGSYHLHGHCHGSYETKTGKILDVGLDSAYNLFGEHRYFTEQDVIDYMAHRKISFFDYHNAKTN